MINLLLDIQRRAVNYYRILEKYKKVDFETLSYEELVSAVMEMQQGNEVLDFLNHITISCYGIF